MSFEVIRAFWADLPDSPGVYRMLGENDEPLYVGKAKSLKKRVASYTREEGHAYRIRRMISLTHRMEFIGTRSEAEALLLEAQLIKRLKPRYNILLKDDKSFPFIMITGDHKYPRIAVHRGARKPEHTYFGPYPNALSVRDSLRFLQKTFLVRPCKDSFFEGRTRPCLEYQIKRCSAPCVNKISEADYNERIKEVKGFLRGNKHDIQTKLGAEMEEAANRMDYEKAAELRDRLKGLAQMQSRMSFRGETADNTDIIAMHMQNGTCAVELFSIRGGQAIGNRAFFPQHVEETTNSEVLENFLARFYLQNPPPPVILLSHALENPEMVEEALSTLVPYKVKIEVPQRGEKYELMKQISKNAEVALDRKMREEMKNRELLAGVAKLFHLPATPERVEVYDNSHISGRQPVGAMIVAGPEGFMKGAYRHYRLDEVNEDTPTGGDDFAMLRFVLRKRLKKLRATKNPEEIPGLMLIDGGAGHLSAATEVFAELGITDVPYVCISKGPDRNAGREEFHQPGLSSFQLPPNDPTLFYLQRLRDEAHRFAITTHRKRRSADIKVSTLDSIPGIGPKRKKALLLHFGSIQAIQEANPAMLQKVPGVNKKSAEEIYRYLHEKQG